MRYVSTRGRAPELSFSDVLLTGLASDGGLYVPAEWPTLGPGGRGDYVETAIEVMTPFVGDDIDPEVFAELVADAYSTFDDDEVTPLRPVGGNVHLLELFHGPTLAFKDVALQLVGRLFDHELSKRGERVTVVGATSGDTGSAAIEALRDRDAVDCFILHPSGRTSEVQRRQMTTVDAPNIHNVAVEGTFDDCQDLVKAMFADEGFRSEIHLSAVNSINWARVMAQVVYYVVSAERLGGRQQPVTFCVPTGNFGNVFAGYVASRMGLRVPQFIVASNHNDILTQFFTTGSMTIGEVSPTLSPSMDIQVSSNLERLLFELHGRDGQAIADMLATFREQGRIEFAPELVQSLSEGWSGMSVDDDHTSYVMSELHKITGILVDPHTAVGFGAAHEMRRDHTHPMVVLGTAHPAKFPAAVESATGIHPPLPPQLADLFEREERYDVLPNDLAEVQAYIRANR